MLLAVGAAALLAAVVTTGASAAPHGHPNSADYNVIISVRDAVVHDARTMLETLSRCERAGQARLDRFNRCIRTRLSVEVELSRFEPVLLSGVVRHLRPGACLELVGAVEGAISDLSEAASGWIADIENGGGRRAKLERQDAQSMRQLGREVIRLRGRPWSRACRPRRGG